MSTTADQINALIASNTALNAYYLGAKAAIEQSLADMNARVDSVLDDIAAALRVTVWVDPVNGSDANDGSEEAPFASLEKGVESTPKNGTGTVHLVDDYYFSGGATIPEASHVVLEIAAGKSLYLMPFIHSTLNENDMGGFNAPPHVASIGMRITGGRVVWPSTPSNGLPMRDDRYLGLISSNAGAGPGFVKLEIVGSDLVMPPDGMGVVLGTDTRANALMVKSTTTTSDFPGHWVAGVVAGTPTHEVPHTLSNLTTL